MTIIPIPAAEPDHQRADPVERLAGKVMALRGGYSRATVTADIRVPMRDGVDLLTDHHAPAGEAVGTVLIRSPYGAGPLFTGLLAGPYLAAGHHVVVQRCRGTFGSGGRFEPMVHEVDDGADTVAWLRTQPWFGGRFATVGPSYLGFVQWALLMDPPPELAAVIIQVGPHDFHDAVYAGGAFALNDFLGWTEMVSHQEGTGLVGAQLRTLTATRRQAPAMAHLPVADAAQMLAAGKAPWYRDWASHRDPDDAFWAPMRLGAALDRVAVPVLLQTGWQDLFLPQTLAQFAHLQERGVDVALTVGPWTHVETVQKGGALLAREGVDWLAEHLTGTGSRLRWSPVRVFVTGVDEWRELPTWPPACVPQELYPHADGVLRNEPAPSDAEPLSFTYDPGRPTPTIGGRLLAATGGYRDDSALAERDDVLSFTTPPLTVPLEVVGNPSVELSHSSDNPHADLFVRISEVDAKGRSHNVSDGFVRLDPGHTGPTVALELDAVAHRFAAGHRIRLLVAGGSFPRWERNLGTDGDPSATRAMSPSRRTLWPAGSRLLLPVKA